MAPCSATPRPYPALPKFILTSTPLSNFSTNLALMFDAHAGALLQACTEDQVAAAQRLDEARRSDAAARDERHRRWLAASAGGATSWRLADQIAFASPFVTEEKVLASLEVEVVLQRWLAAGSSSSIDLPVATAAVRSDVAAAWQAPGPVAAATIEARALRTAALLRLPNLERVDALLGCARDHRDCLRLLSLALGATNATLLVDWSTCANATASPAPTAPFLYVPDLSTPDHDTPHDELAQLAIDFSYLGATTDAARAAIAECSLANPARRAALYRRTGVTPAPNATRTPCRPFAEPALAATKCLAHFIVPGVEKGASTFLFQSLSSHPHLVHPLTGSGFKEVGLYLSSGQLARGGVAARYRALPFLDPQDGLVVGDGSVYYAVDRAAPARIAAEAPHTRFILVLREPVARAYSAYRVTADAHIKGGVTFSSMTSQSLLDDLDFCFHAILGNVSGAAAAAAFATARPATRTALLDTFLNPRSTECGRTRLQQALSFRHVVRLGLYAIQLASLLESFPREAVKVVFMEELVADPHPILRDCLDFLGLEPAPLTLGVRNTNDFTGSLPDGFGMTDAVAARLGRFFAPHNAMLAAMLGRDLPPTWTRTS